MKKLLSGWLVLSSVILAGCAASIPPAVGIWDVEMTIPQLGALPATMTVNEDGSGSMSLGPLGEAPIEGISFDGNTLGFVGEFDAQGNMIVLEFSGEVDGDAISGEFQSDFGAMTVTGSRQ